MPAKKLPKFLIFTLLTWLTKNLLFKFFRKPRTEEPSPIVEEEGNGPKEYSLKSNYLWEETPDCSPEYKIEYAAPVFYQQEVKRNRVQPTVKPEVPGFFSAYPGGLYINRFTGEIDINASDTGICYTVEFNPCGEKCAAKTNVVISGIWYPGRIFSLTTSPRQEYTAQPLYNGDPKEQLPPGTFGLSNNKCPQASDLNGLVIDAKTGEIDLKKTITSGALGFRKNGDLCGSFPANGTSKDFKIYYRLNDQSKGALNETHLRLHFYDTKEDIPYELRRRIEQQNNSVNRPKRIRNLLPLLLGTSLTILPDASWEVLAALLAALTSLLFLTAQGSDDPCRPPEHCATK